MLSRAKYHIPGVGSITSGFNTSLVGHMVSVTCYCSSTTPKLNNVKKKKKKKKSSWILEVRNATDMDRVQERFVSASRYLGP